VDGGLQPIEVVVSINNQTGRVSLIFRSHGKDLIMFEQTAVQAACFAASIMQAAQAGLLVLSGEHPFDSNLN